MNKNKGRNLVILLLVIAIISAAAGIYFIKKSKSSSSTDTTTTASATLSDTSAKHSTELTESDLTENNETETDKSTGSKEETVSNTSKRITTTQKADGSTFPYAYAGFNPADAKIVDGKWYLIVLNTEYKMPDNYKYSIKPVVEGNIHKLDTRVAPHYTAMYNAAKADGITLTPYSGHRRLTTQKNNLDNKIQSYMNQGYSKVDATKEAIKWIQIPGCSEHNAGLAMDIISTDVSFENTKAFKWLQENAEDYGFIMRYAKNKESITKIHYEPWHWRYVGVDDAKAINASGQCLEEYMGLAK